MHQELLDHCPTWRRSNLLDCSENQQRISAPVPPHLGGFLLRTQDMILFQHWVRRNEQTVRVCAEKRFNRKKNTNTPISPHAGTLAQPVECRHIHPQRHARTHAHASTCPRRHAHTRAHTYTRGAPTSGGWVFVFVLFWFSIFENGPVYVVVLIFSVFFDCSFSVFSFYSKNKKTKIPAGISEWLALFNFDNF